MCDNFIKTNFNEKINNAYSMLPIGVMKADLWRYCIIYKNGGIYSDVDTVCKINPIIFMNNSLLTFVPENDTNLFCQWSFSAPKNSPILKTIIDLSVERILTNQIKGKNIIHFLTGPQLFTDGIELFLKKNNFQTFDNRIQYINYPNSIIKVFDSNTFHKYYIIHLFAGDDDDGWKIESNKKINN